MAILQGVTVTGSAHFSGSLFVPMVENTTGLNLAPGQIVFDKNNDEIIRGHKTEAFKRGLGDKGDSGTAGTSGTSGTSGANGNPGTSGTSGTSGANGNPGTSGTSGTSGATGTSYLVRSGTCSYRVPGSSNNNYGCSGNWLGPASLSTISQGYNSSFIGSGAYNTVTAHSSFIGGGSYNNINLSSNSFIGNGACNSILSTTSCCNSIVGGCGNQICTSYHGGNFIGGGSLNCINGSYGGGNAIIAGYNNINSATRYTTIAAGTGITAKASCYLYASNICNVNGGTSDCRLKENITPLTHSLNQITQLEPVSFNFKTDETKKTRYGFLAQCVQNVMPDIITDHPSDIIGSTPVLQFEKDAIWSSMVNAIKDLKDEVDALKARVTTLEG